MLVQERTIKTFQHLHLLQIDHKHKEVTAIAFPRVFSPIRLKTPSDIFFSSLPQIVHTTPRVSPHSSYLSMHRIIVYDRSATLFSASVLALSFESIYMPSQLTLLGQEQTIALLDSNPVPRVLVVRGETSGMCALADFAVDDLFKRVNALGWVLWVGDEHEMHAGIVSTACG
jgi:hypothetical protein